MAADYSGPCGAGGEGLHWPAVETQQIKHGHKYIQNKEFAQKQNKNPAFNFPTNQEVKSSFTTSLS